MMSKKLFSVPTLLLAILGLAFNILLVWMTKLFGVPLYLDSIGTVLAAALGGVLPGIAVGFLSNCVTALLSVSPDSMTLYYGFLNVLIAVIAAWLSKNGFFLKWYGRVAGVFAFSAVGGVLGSVVTWILYGFSFGQGISAPLATFFFRQLHMGEFPAQLTADLGIDLADKILTVAVVCLILTFLPDSLMEKLPLGAVYRGKRVFLSPEELREKKLKQLREERQYRKHSIHTKITALILTSTILLSVVALAISITTYRHRLITQYSTSCENAVSLMLTKIDAGQVETFLTQGEQADEYTDTEQDLYTILNSEKDVRYMYVYRIESDGCHVVFDLDADGLAGEQPGAVVPFDASFPYVEELLAGQTIPAVITNDTYGWLLTVYKPIVNSENQVVAYAAADISMADIRTDVYTFLIKIASLLFGMMVLITTFSLWYCDRKLLDPMSVLAEQARNFDYTGERQGGRVRDQQTVQTGDELEEVFEAMCRSEDAMAEHVAELQRKNLEISHMQRNIIYTLANMVENRDGNTGGHIKRTAGYVRLIGQKLQVSGAYAGTVDDGYVKNLYDSAPLHDIGKVKIPDAILNKPGKLTAEEFEIMKIHTTEGRNILRTSLSEIEDDSWLAMAIDMAAYHHEKWDGSGYPEGKSGEGIPLCARIMAVSDVFDALVSARSYKAAYPVEEAFQIIQDGSGKHFDPQIVQVFLDSKPEILKIMNG